MKKVKIVSILFIMAYAISILTACSEVKNIHCGSVKYMPVTFVTKSGRYYTVNVPFCDTVRLNNNNIPDTVKTIITPVNK